MAHKSRAEHICTAETHSRGLQGNFHIWSGLFIESDTAAYLLIGSGVVLMANQCKYCSLQPTRSRGHQGVEMGRFRFGAGGGG